MGRKTDSFHNQNTSKRIKSDLYNSSNLCTSKGDALLHADLNEPSLSSSTGELHQKSVVENVTAANKATARGFRSDISAY